jgi:4-hydroxy-L-threonine phosphate dehydrogenase PdxA
VSDKKPIIAITIGDYNGIGCEVILKAFADNRLFDFCIPVVYGSTKIIAYHKKVLNIDTVNHQQLKPGSSPSPKMLNVVNCIDDNVIINRAIIGTGR